MAKIKKKHHQSAGINNGGVVPDVATAENIENENNDVINQ